MESLKVALTLKADRKDLFMLKKLFDLQLFAEDGGTEAPTTETPSTDNGDVKDSDTTAAKAGAKYTDEDVDRILNQKFAQWQKKQEKAVDEAKKLERMDAQQKAEYERDQLKKELDELKQKAAHADMTATARKLLSEENISIPDEIVSVLVSTDAAETKTRIEGFSKAFNEAVEKAVKERIKGTTPTRGSGPSSSKMTKEEIMKIKNPDLRQQKMLENKELFGL